MVQKRQSFGHVLKWIIPLTVCILISWPLLIQGGNLEPPSGPEPTMKSLDDIYNAVQDVQFAVDNLQNQTPATQGTIQKTGFTQHFTHTNYDNIPKYYPIVTVPADQQLVIVNLLAKGRPADFEIWRNDTHHHTLLDSDVLNYSETSVGRHVFPEPCVSLSGGDQLYLKLYPKAIPDPPYYQSTLEFTLFGYYTPASP